MIRGCIFDLDGTLLDTIDDLSNSMNFALKTHHLDTHPKDAYYRFVGNGIDTMVSRALPSGTNPDLFNKVKDTFLTTYAKHECDLTRPYPGIEELLTLLVSKQIKIAIVTNKKHERMLTIVKELLPDFAFVALFGDDGSDLKPNPTKVLHAIEQMQLSKQECLYIGDSDVDMQTAINADIKGIGVTWGFRSQTELKKAGATHIIDFPLDLMKLI